MPGAAPSQGDHVAMHFEEGTSRAISAAAVVSEPPGADDTDIVSRDFLSTLRRPLRQQVRKMSARRFNTLAAPYGPDAPRQTTYSEYVDSSYNSKVIPTMRQSWEKFLARSKARIFVPYFPWWGNRTGYLRKGLLNDALAGLTCAVLVIPDSLSYMLLASLAPVVGLITAALAPFGYALLGTSRHVSVGPISLVSLFLPSIFRELGHDLDDRSDAALADRQDLASVLAFYTFVIFGLMSVLKLGGVVKFCSQDIMTGT